MVVVRSVLVVPRRTSRKRLEPRGLSGTNPAWQLICGPFRNKPAPPILGSYSRHNGEMSGTLLVGTGREIRRVPDDDFLRAVQGIPARMASRLAFMTPDHHVIRNFVVRDLPRQRRPLSARHIANATRMGSQHVSAVLSDLEKRLFFLVRDSSGNVDWAFPVTSCTTPHRLEFSTGENIFGA
jgi:hypothetical protein